MARFVSNPADRGTPAIGATHDGDSLAKALGRFVYALVRPVCREMRFREIRGNLQRLDDRVLHDIGLQRGEISVFARTLADLRWPARGPAARALIALAGLAWRRCQSGWERRATIQTLRLLDDRLLKDIGVERSDIPALADRLVRPWSELVGAASGHRRVAYAPLASEAVTEGQAQRKLPPGIEGTRTTGRAANDDRLAKAS